PLRTPAPLPYPTLFRSDPGEPAQSERHQSEQSHHGGDHRQVPPAGGAGVVEGPGDDGVVRDGGRRAHRSSSWSSVRSWGCGAGGGGPPGAEGVGGEASGPSLVDGSAVASVLAPSDAGAAVAAAPEATAAFSAPGRARRAPRTRALPPGWSTRRRPIR